ncbi:Signal recognition particle subunit SRP68 [Hondaea fermentalgiana]|uniref:Signal recognition particle subunit SRP68 n=1 Tax=Hondaea fermentalgiana TaxID=2315210 RepID=A0A2R5GG74_9STRA|nr:Signal recognition particle subunit SRP68 [Hondaea fermentalgiana]|eukprot:GBG29906.1 Signal recognition particle subunit SRP68 [Hondaea fermentalgiana]
MGAEKDGPTEPAAEAAAAAGPQEKLSLNILEAVKTSQQQNGLRHRDYQRYRQYCTRRLRRLRKNKRVDFKLAGKNPREAFQGRELTAEDCTDERFLQLALVNAERAWGYAMQLKDENQRDGEEPRKRLHLVRRLAKATRWSAKLRELCHEVADDRTTLEAEAYAAWMQGNLLLEKEWWKDAYLEFEKARNVYEQLSSIVEPELRELMQERIEDIEPALRYCKYNLSREEGPGKSQDALKQLQIEAEGSDLLQAKIKKVIEENRKIQAEQASTVSWRGHQVPVRSPALRVKLLEIRDQLSALEEAKNAAGGDGGDGDDLEAAFLETLSVCDDTLRLAREEKSKPSKASSSSTANPEKIAEEYDYIRAYIKTQKLLISIDRNMLYASKMLREMDGQKTTVKPQDLVHIYDQSLQSVHDILDLLGPDAEQHSAEEDVVSAPEMRVQEGICTAFRTLLIGRTYQAQAKWAQAVALFEHNFTRITETRAMDGVTTSQLKQLDDVERKTRAAKCLALAHAFRARLGGSTASQAVPQLSGSATDDAPVLCELPPSIDAVPAHPILFDLASSELRIGKLPKGSKAAKSTSASASANVSSSKDLASVSTQDSTQDGEAGGEDGEEGSGWLSSARNWFGRSGGR